MEKHSSLGAYITSLATSVFGVVTLQDAAAAVGIATAIGTFIVNWYYKEREARRHEGS